MITAKFLSVSIGLLGVIFSPSPSAAHNLSLQDSTKRSNSDSAAVRQVAAPETSAPSGRQSWTSGKRDYRIGDIIAIAIDEYTLTSLSKRIDASDSRRREIGVNMNTPTKRTSISGGGANNSSSQDRGSDARSNRIVTEMSARVTEIAPNGNIKIEGIKSIEIEKSTILLTMSGWARAQDIDVNNEIISFKLADSKLAYRAEGPLASSKKSIISKILSKVWP